jgi:hypothetical protein
MDATKDITPQHEHLAEPMSAHGSNVVSSWTRGRREVTPWAYPHLRGLGAIRLTIGAALLIVSVLLLTIDHDVWAAVPLSAAVLIFAIGGMDTIAARSAHGRG